MKKFAVRAGLASCISILLASCGGGNGPASDAATRAVAQSATSTSLIIVSASTALTAGTDQSLAHVVVLLNGIQCGTFDAALARTDYSLPIDSACTTIPSPSTVQVQFENDASNRDLVVYGVTINGIQMPPTLADYLRYDKHITQHGQQKLFWAGELRFPYVTADGYFVDATAGNDSTGNGSLGAPFKTLQRTMNVNTTGKSVHLRCGNTWYEDFREPLGAGSGLDSYGTDPLTGDCTAKPVISGADVAIATADSTGIMTATLGNSDTVARVTVDGKSVPLAEWPSQAGSAPSNYALAAAGSTSSLTLGADAPGGDLTGATISMRTRAYTVTTRKVLSQSGKTLNFDPLNAGDGVVASGVGYVLQNSRQLLSSSPGFFQNGSMLYVVPPTPAASATVEYAHRDWPVKLANSVGFTIHNIKVTNGRTNGIDLWNTPGMLLDHVESSGNGGSGLTLGTRADPSQAGTTVRDSVFDDNWVAGIDASNAVNTVIQDNKVTHTGTSTPLASKAAIRAASAATVARNEIDGATSSAILIQPVVAATIDGNVIRNYCTRFTDCGAIYSANESRYAATAGRVAIKNNVVGPATANLQGAIGEGIAVVAGIYMDDYTTQVDITGNTLYGMPIGISLHNSSQDTVSGNNIWLTATAGIAAGMSTSDHVDHLAGDVVNANEIVPLNTVNPGTGALPVFGLSNAYNYVNAAQGIAGLGDIFKGNTIYALNGDGTGRFATVGLLDSNSTLSTRAISFSEWQSDGSNDMMGTPAVTVPLYNTQTVSTSLDEHFDETSPTAWIYGQGKNGSPGGSSILTNVDCDQGNCLKVLVTDQSDKVSNPQAEDFQLTSNGDIYLTSFIVKVLPQSTFIGPALLLDPYFRQRGLGDSLTVGLVSDRMMSAAPGATISYQSLFQAQTVSNAVYGLQMNSPGVPVTIDSIAVKKVTVKLNPVASWAAVASAPLTGSAVIDCGLFAGSSGSGCNVVDLAGNTVPMPTTIPAGQAKLLLKTH